MAGARIYTNNNELRRKNKGLGSQMGAQYIFYTAFPTLCKDMVLGIRET